VLPTVVGCYKPSVVDGKLECGAASACPDDFSCVSGHCWRGGMVSPDGGSEDTGLPVDMSGPDLVCGGPVPECTPSSTGVCDPVCQTGCACPEKCSYSSKGELACVPLAPQNARTEPCDVFSYGAPEQSDNCIAGDVCLYPGGRGTTNGFCFALCSSDVNCPGSRCVTRPVAPPPDGTSTPPPVASVCDTPFEPCDPFTNAGCTDPDRPKCYLASPDPLTGASRTQCEYVAGSLTSPDTCTWSRDCVSRFACPEKGASWPRAGFCLPVCDPAHPCPSGGTCKPYGSTYGYCVMM
jgi:hypothetical protein